MAYIAGGPAPIRSCLDNGMRVNDETHCPTVPGTPELREEKGTGLAYNPVSRTLHRFEEPSDLSTIVGPSMVRDLLILRDGNGKVIDPKTYASFSRPEELNSALTLGVGLSLKQLSQHHEKQQSRRPVRPSANSGMDVVIRQNNKFAI